MADTNSVNQLYICFAKKLEVVLFGILYDAFDRKQTNIHYDKTFFKTSIICIDKNHYFTT